MTKESIVLVGGGGHAKVVIAALRTVGQFDIAGIVDRQWPPGHAVEGVKVVGGDAELTRLFDDGVRQAFITVGSTGDTAIRRRIAGHLREIGYVSPAICHATAWVAPSVHVQPGAFIAAGVVVQPGCSIGAHAIINSRASIDHDCSIGDFVHVAPGTTCSGGVVVHDDAHVGTGCTIIENRTIGAGAIVGAGSVVVDDVPGGCTAFGHPCRVQGELAP